MSEEPVRSAVFAPKLSTLSPSQRVLWPQLTQIPETFTLFGGTALAVQRAHRHSVDFDFFAFEAINPENLLQHLPLLQDCEVVQQQHDTLSVRTAGGEPVALSFFGLPDLQTPAPPRIAADNGLSVASLQAIAATKASVVQRRAAAKDYLDLDELFRAGITLKAALATARTMYGFRFTPELTLKALCHFDDGDLRSLPAETRDRLARLASTFDLASLDPPAKGDEQ